MQPPVYCPMLPCAGIPESLSFNEAALSIGYWTLLPLSSMILSAIVWFICMFAQCPGGDVACPPSTSPLRSISMPGNTSCQASTSNRVRVSQAKTNGSYHLCGTHAYATSRSTIRTQEASRTHPILVI